MVRETFTDETSASAAPVRLLDRGAEYAFPPDRPRAAPAFEEWIMGKNREELRRFPRIENSAIVESTRLTYPLDAAPSEMGLSRNIGPEGICLKTPTPFKAGEILSLKIDLPGWQRYKHSVAAIVDDDKAVAPLAAVVEVVWCRESAVEDAYEMGVRFRDVYEDDRKALMRYLENLNR